MPLLADLNRQLVEDQGSRNPSDLSGYQARFTDWIISEEWTPSLFEDGETVLGYSVHRIGQDDYYPDIEFVTLRQFFISRNVRRRGYGTAAFALFQTEIAKGRTISIDVLASNPDGASFWEDLGFEPYYTNMKLNGRV